MFDEPHASTTRAAVIAVSVLLSLFIFVMLVAVTMWCRRKKQRKTIHPVLSPVLTNDTPVAEQNTAWSNDQEIL